jgi:hypothetical protein
MLAGKGDRSSAPVLAIHWILAAFDWLISRRSIGSSIFQVLMRQSHQQHVMCEVIDRATKANKQQTK